MSKKNLDLTNALEQQKAAFIKIKDRVEQQSGTDTRASKLIEMLTAVSNDPAALEALREAIDKHYGE